MFAKKRMLDIQKVQEIIKPLTAQIPEGIELAISKSEFLQPKQAKVSKRIFFVYKTNTQKGCQIRNNYELTNEWNVKHVNYQLSLCNFLLIFCQFFIPSICSWQAISPNSTQNSAQSVENMSKKAKHFV